MGKKLASKHSEDRSDSEINLTAEECMPTGWLGSHTITLYSFSPAFITH